MKNCFYFKVMILDDETEHLILKGNSVDHDKYFVMFNVYSGVFVCTDDFGNLIEIYCKQIYVFL